MKKLWGGLSSVLPVFVMYWNISKATGNLEIKCESINGNFYYKSEGEWLYEKNKETRRYKLLQNKSEIQYGLIANDLPSYINTISINHEMKKVKKFTGIGPNDFIELFNCEFFSKKNVKDIN